MFHPTLTEPNTARVTLRTFGGLDCRPVIADGAFSAMENLSADAYPALTTRPARGRMDLTGCRAMLWKDGLVWLDAAGTLHAGGHTLDHFADPSDGAARQLVSMGAWVCVFPDKNWCNTQRLAAGTLTDADHGSLERTYTTTGAVEVAMCTEDAASYDGEIAAASAPADPENGAYWLDTSHRPSRLFQWSEADGAWVRAAGTYVRFTAQNIGADFAVGDTVSLEHFVLNDEDEVLSPQLAAIQAQKRTIRARDTHYIVVDGVLDALGHVADHHAALCLALMDQGYTWDELDPLTDEALVALLGYDLPLPTVRRTVPDLDYVTESGNRLWGCRYDGQVNEIYACCLGDPTNWWRFDGLASDAYQASRGADGPFTGAAAYNGSVLFFRQRSLEKVYPSAAGAHQIVTVNLDGVAPGCADSLRIVDGVLYYLSDRGVMAYDGSLPVSVSAGLAPGSCTAAAAGSWQGRYYLSVRTNQGDHLLVYDTRRGLWHREDETVFVCACAGAEDLYFADPDGQVWAQRGSQGTAVPVRYWRAETGLLGLELPDHQHTGRIDLRLALPTGSRLLVSIQYDADGVWVPVANVSGYGTRIFTLPIRPRRCAHLRLRLEGTGQMTLYGITRRYEQGSER